MATKRAAIHAFVSDEAHLDWHNTATEAGISLSALLESLAPRLSKLEGEQWTDVVRDARHVDATRRRRPKSTRDAG